MSVNTTQCYQSFYILCHIKASHIFVSVYGLSVGHVDWDNPWRNWFPYIAGKSLCLNQHAKKACLQSNLFVSVKLLQATDVLFHTDLLGRPKEEMY